MTNNEINGFANAFNEACQKRNNAFRDVYGIDLPFEIKDLYAAELRLEIAEAELLTLLNLSVYMGFKIHYSNDRYGYIKSFYIEVETYNTNVIKSETIKYVPKYKTTY